MPTRGGTCADYTVISGSCSATSVFQSVNRMLGPGMFSPASTRPLDDRMEMYFQDLACMPLFIQVCDSLFVAMADALFHVGELSAIHAGSIE